MDFGVQLESTRGLFSGTKAQEARQEEGDTVDIQFKLPNGEVKQHTFKTGHTIAFVKLQLQEHYDFPMSKLQLKHNGKALIDPFSISDCPALLKADAGVVDVDLLE